jgi:hypothetical protein
MIYAVREENQMLAEPIWDGRGSDSDLGTPTGLRSKLLSESRWRARMDWLVIERVIKRVATGL